MSTPIMLSNLQCYIAAYAGGTLPSTASDYKALGDSKSAAEISYEEKYSEVKTIESGNEAVKAVMDTQTVMGKITVSDLTLAKLEHWAGTVQNFDGMAVSNSIGTVTNKVGQTVSEYIIRLHPVENVADYSLDIIITKAIINKKFEKKGAVGDQASVILDFKGMWDDAATPKKLVIGTAVATP